MSSKAGRYPFRSGIHEKMYRERPWTIRQYAGFGNPTDSNQRFKELILQGTTGLSVAFDLPTQMGLDPDNSLASGEVGQVGVSLWNLDGMRQLFDDVDIENISTSMTINATAPILLLMYVIVAEERNINIKNLRGTIQNDILKEFISRSTFIFSPEYSMELTGQLFKYCVEQLPNWNPISISGYHMEEAGANHIQEIAFTFANAFAYIDEFTKTGLTIDQVVPKFTFFFSSRISLLQEVAKFRAAREIWAEMLKEKFDFESEKPLKLRFHTQTAGSELLAQNPELNIARVTIQALAAILGGTQSLHTNAFDEALRLPTNFSSAIAANIQKIIMNETSLKDFIDPFEDSLEVESLTESVKQQIIDEIRLIESMGGALTGIQNDYQRNQIAIESYRRQMEIETGVRELVTFNDQVNLKEENIEATNLGSTMTEITKLKEFKRLRDNQSTLRQLSHLQNVISRNSDPIREIKASLQKDATLGEIVQAIKHGLESRNDGSAPNA